VLLEGDIKNPQPDLKQKIEYKIKQISHIINHVKKNITSEEDRFNARMFCVFGVLSWLESKELIKPSKQASSIQEGGIRVSYEIESVKPSYTVLQSKFLVYLLGPPPTPVNTR